MRISDWSSDGCSSDLALMLTGAGTSVPMFHQAYREAGAAARVLLCKAAAERWDVAWESCDIRDGIVSDGGKRPLELGEVVEDAETFDLPELLPFRKAAVDRLAGKELTRLDPPSKIDAIHNYNET